MAGGEQQRRQPAPDHPCRSCKEDARHAIARYGAMCAIAPAITPVGARVGRVTARRRPIPVNRLTRLIGR
jgi:hypothetical protein